MLALLRHTGWHQEQLRKGNWTKNVRVPSCSLSDSSIGLVGCGAISRALIELLKPFQSPVSVLSSSRFTDEEARRLGVIRVDTIEQLLNENDIISLHLPLKLETHHMINEFVFSCFRKGAYLINTSRGGLIDEQGLTVFMQQHPGWISGVAVDTFESEGADFSSPLQQSEEVLLTPHIAGTTQTALLNAALRVQEGILIRLSG